MVLGADNFSGSTFSDALNKMNRGAELSSIRIEVTSKQATLDSGEERTEYGLVAYRLDPPEIVFQIDGLSKTEQEIISLASMLTDSSVTLDRFRALLGE